MAIFHLHIRDGDTLIEDVEGGDFPTLNAVTEEATRGGRGMLADKVRAGEVVDGQCIEITDEAGVLLATVRLRDLIRLVDE